MAWFCSLGIFYQPTDWLMLCSFNPARLVYLLFGKIRSRPDFSQAAQRPGVMPRYNAMAGVVAYDSKPSVFVKPVKS